MNVITLALLLLMAPLPRHVKVFESTAYCLKGKTSMGTYVRDGVVAVDPKIIPLGSYVFCNGRWFRAEDTGKLIKSYRIDIWKPSHKDCIRWGRRKVLVAW